MKFLIQILFLVFTWFSSSATFSVPKIVVSTNTTFFQKIEKVTHLEKAKIDLENFARSSLDEQQAQTSTFHQNTFLLSSYLKEENSCAFDFQKTGFPYQFKVAQFSKKERLSELENRAREVLEVYFNGAGNVFDLSVFKNLTAKIPGGVNSTNIGNTLFDDALKFKPATGSQKTLLNDIIANGDNAIDGVASGSKTEALVDDIFQAQGYTKVD